MKTFSDLRENLKSARLEIEAKMPLIVREYALNAKALSERRIRTEGFGFDYSTKEVPAYFFLSKTLNQAGKAEIKKRSKKKEGLTWGALKEVQGLNGEFVDLAYSNEMWRGIVVVQNKQTGTVFYALLGHTNQAGQQKMNWNYERFGNFIMKGLNENDKKFLATLPVDSMMEIVKKHI